MPYAKYRGRSSYRKAGRSARTLSTRRIFSNKGSKAQAKQIYALRRAVNRVKAQCKPEVKVRRTAIDERGLALSSTASPGTVNWSVVRHPMPDSGTSDSTRIGNKIRLVAPKMFIALQYVERLNSAQSFYNSTLQNHGIQVRLIAVQAKVAHTETPQLTDILQNVNFDSQIDSVMMMRQPFQIGITSKYNILLDKHMTVDLDNPTKTYRVTLKPKSRSVIWEDGQSRAKGEIYWFILGGGYSLRRFESGEEIIWDANEAQFSFRMETAFTDA